MTGRPRKSAGKRKHEGGVRRIFVAAMALVVVFFGGTIGFMLIEDWGFWRSFFFTLITVTTVGYTAEGLSATGKGCIAGGLR